MSQKAMFRFDTQVEFAQFGRDTIAYVRRVNSGDFKSRYGDDLEDDDLPEDDIDLWGLFAANGEPIALSDDKQMLFENALEHDLVTVSRQ